MYAGGIVTLTTDFGMRDSYVAQMKGAIISIALRLTLIDVTHAISRHSIVQAAFIVSDVWRTYPDETAHIVVVDPGVGTDRRPIAIQAFDQYFVGPDNGVFSRVIEEAEERGSEWRAVALTKRDYWRAQDVSATFHGRDIFAPAAAHLVNGTFLTNLGDTITDPVRLTLPAPYRNDAGIHGEIIYIDGFGNCVTNIPASALPLPDTAGVTVTANDRTFPYVVTYGRVEDGAPVALIGSHGYLELAVRRGSAEQTLGLSVGTAVTVPVT